MQVNGKQKTEKTEKQKNGKQKRKDKCKINLKPKKTLMVAF